MEKLEDKVVKPLQVNKSTKTGWCRQRRILAMALVNGLKSSQAS